MKKITFDIEYTAHDYYLANKLHVHPHTGWMYALGPILIFAGIVSFSISPGKAMIPILLGIFLFTYKHVYLRLLAKHMFAGLDLKTKNYFIIDDSGVENRYGNGNSKHSWDEIIDIQHDKKIFLLYIAKYKFFIIPIRSVTTSDWSELIRLEEARGNKQS